MIFEIVIDDKPLQDFFELKDYEQIIKILS
jgi:hypothetical protein